jgi:N-acetylmuramidase/Putative peptidoglycan binding domain
LKAVGAPLDAQGLKQALAVLSGGAAELWAVIAVETSGCGFLPDGRTKILFERHVFSKHTGGRFDTRHPDISNPSPGGYLGDAGEYTRLRRALALDHQPPLLATSWGLGQVMGYNAKYAGYPTVGAMVEAFGASESAQVVGMANFIKTQGLAAALQAHDWARFARGYNGPAYRKNSYDTRLAAHLEFLKHGGLPDVTVRAAQVHLTYLGHDVRGIDGVMGRFTRSALNQFQQSQGLPVTDKVDAATFEALKRAAAKRVTPASVARPSRESWCRA